MRCRCKVVLALVQGKTPTMIAPGGLCAKSQVYRVAGQFEPTQLKALRTRLRAGVDWLAMVDVRLKSPILATHIDVGG
jgi:hypothetical protein